MVAHLRKASLVGADALDEFHVFVKVFEFIPCRPKHHDGRDVRVGARVAPIRVVVRAHHLRHGDDESFPYPIETSVCGSAIEFNVSYIIQGDKCGWGQTLYSGP